MHVGVCTTLLVLLARDEAEAHALAGQELGDEVKAGQREVFGGMHRPSLAAFIAPQALVELEAQVRQGGVLRFVWALRRS